MVTFHSVTVIGLILLLLSNISFSSLKPNVYWYTNIHLQNNQRIYETEPSVYNGFYFCCGQYEFKADGTFVFKNSTDLIKNINYFRKKMDFIYIHGGTSSNDIFNVPSSTLKTQFEQARKVAKQINIDGFLFDYEPHTGFLSIPSIY